jgi:hypothetical protein
MGAVLSAGWTILSAVVVLVDVGAGEMALAAAEIPVEQFFIMLAGGTFAAARKRSEYGSRNDTVTWNNTLLRTLDTAFSDVAQNAVIAYVSVRY